MTPPKREDRLNPMSRRRGRPPGPPPGPEWMVLGTTITCNECEWTAIDTDAQSAVASWQRHARLRHPDIKPEHYSLEEQ
jgi:hypothetical protein